MLQLHKEHGTITLVSLASPAVLLAKGPRWEFQENKGRAQIVGPRLQGPNTGCSRVQGT